MSDARKEIVERIVEREVIRWVLLLSSIPRQTCSFCPCFWLLSQSLSFLPFIPSSFLSLFLSLIISIFIYLFIYSFIHFFLYLFIYLFIYFFLSFFYLYLFICLFICFFIYSFIYLFIYLYIYTFIYLFPPFLRFSGRFVWEFQKRK